MKLAATVVDIVAATLAWARELDELERAYDGLKATRRALAQAEKLRALGAMAAGGIVTVRALACRPRSAIASLLSSSRPKASRAPASVSRWCTSSRVAAAALESPPSGGARFRVWLPAARDP